MRISIVGTEPMGIITAARHARVRGYHRLVDAGDVLGGRLTEGTASSLTRPSV